ncbi:MAG: pantoate--beta-alanine ligase [Candidatus Tectomicrobia bacterium RIFCSPLOWO2_12_FULL_69_37]|nr:MAG: pantoate--beta-alanine ligase [Candidatus Tectomicrobia bacterium RIFCSPLOWO2_02_FULL_70_19]OGL69611.1 MAG: pantoate--beta-alanine ligase [Candidatus Tectomicrobia bacterium RIFCSPLOWO2_12_FULL_69_37]
MRLIQTLSEMQEAADALRRERPPLGLVPTMGALHEGHRSLIRRAADECGEVVVSLFVNPAQFGPGEDYGRYPRTFEADMALCEGEGVAAIYHPSAEAMYPPGFSSRVEVPPLAEGLCGPHRPGHFRGVATVVLKLFAACRPHRAYFGEKDYQQLVIVRRLARDLDLGVEVVGCPTVREPDGLALSSRNAYLTAEERPRALSLIRGLRRAEAMLASGERETVYLVAAAREEMARAGVQPDYAEVVHPGTLAPLDEVEGEARMAVAARVGGTRLIDNIPLRAGP